MKGKDIMKRLVCRSCALFALLAASAIGACGVTGYEDAAAGSGEGQADSLEGMPSAESREALASCTPYLGAQCYWMENKSGNYCWVPATWASSFQDCYAQDSCNGGLSHSGGGCYKWADCSGCNRYPWQ
jgi:hypothetical protein